MDGPPSRFLRFLHAGANGPAIPAGTPSAPAAHLPVAALPPGKTLRRTGNFSGMDVEGPEIGVRGLLRSEAGVVRITGIRYADGHGAAVYCCDRKGSPGWWLGRLDVW
jgi:hypothetical protein